MQTLIISPTNIVTKRHVDCQVLEELAFPGWSRGMLLALS